MTTQGLRAVATHAIIILFCLWHVFAVGIFPVPRDAAAVIPTAMRRFLLPIVTPYMYGISQWQLWNLFSPDPIRRVTTYRIEAEGEDGWATITLIDEQSYGWRQHAITFKLLMNILSEFEVKTVMRRRFLALACREHALPEGTSVRLVYRSSVLPLLNAVPSNAEWRAYRPEQEESIGATILCPAPLPTAFPPAP